MYCQSHFKKITAPHFFSGPSEKGGGIPFPNGRNLVRDRARPGGGAALLRNCFFLLARFSRSVELAPGPGAVDRPFGVKSAGKKTRVLKTDSRRLAEAATGEIYRTP